MGSFAALNAALVVVVLMVALSQQWPALLRNWVQSKVNG